MARRKQVEIELEHTTLTADDVVADYRLAARSRQASLIGRREVMSGRAKFGIFGDGKEVAQVACAKAFRHGDFRSGYYRDQTLMFALEKTEISHFFAQLYAHADVVYDPMSAGRSMNAHFATRSLDPDGRWLRLVDMHNSAADLSPTGSQMPKLVGLAYASRLYRELGSLADFTDLDGFSRNGDEIAYGTIGNATCAEGMFWEAVNAIGVLCAPAIISIWDDDYGISVHSEHQVTNGDVGALLSGFQRKDGDDRGFEIRRVRGWEYDKLVDTYLELEAIARRDHVPGIVHVVELTQPQGHSTSGSHERYKPKERLAWEREFDCLFKMRQWMINMGIATAAEIDRIDDEAQAAVEAIRAEAWAAFREPIEAEREEVLELLQMLGDDGAADIIVSARNRLAALPNLWRRDLQAAAHDVLLATRHEDSPARRALQEWRRRHDAVNADRFGSHLTSESAEAIGHVATVAAAYPDEPRHVNGFEVLNACFDAMFARDPRVVAFGEDLGFLGGVNQSMKGLQEKFGLLRVSDTGIRECTILGQAIGLAMRGLRPIAEIQYLDYLLYALQLMSDDLATLHWRTRGGQKAPVIVRTRGHRLEGTWHAGSPMAGIINLVRGVNVLVPRDMTRAAGFYNTLLASDEPGLIVEVLNGYRLKEPLPSNIGEMRLAVGQPEVLRSGADLTVVTYGACCRIVMQAAERLAAVGVDAEVIDVQSLLPFDIDGRVGESVRKTGRVVFVDEDVPGGTTAYMMQHVLELQHAYYDLDSPPVTLSARAHRTAYGTDGDYWTKPNIEDVVAVAYELMHEVDPVRYPAYLS